MMRARTPPRRPDDDPLIGGDEPLVRPHDDPPIGGGDEPLIMFLEPDQLVEDKGHPVPRAPLGAHARAALWALRVFVLIVSAMVIYTFFAQLGG